MKLYIYESDIQKVSAIYTVMSESKEYAAKLITIQFYTQLHEFDFKSYIQKCIDQRQQLIDLIDDVDVKQKYIDGVNEWKTWNTLEDHVFSRLQEFEPDKVIEHILD